MLPILLLLSILILPPMSYAETKVITAEATYTMGDGESPSFAEAMVLQKAKQMALEQAGTYVESYTKTKNYDLTHEEIQTIAGGVLQVEVLEKTRTLVGDGLRFSIKIKATVTTDTMEELAQRIKGKNVTEEYKKLQEDYDRLSKDIETWKQLISKTPQGTERDAALDQIKERERAFASVQRREAAFYQRLFSSEGILAEAASQLSKKQVDKEILETLMKWITAQGYLITHQKPRVNTSIKQPGRATVTIPLSVTLTSEAKDRLAEVVQQLGGSTQMLKQPTRETVCSKDTNPKPSHSAFPVILSQDPELQGLFLELVNTQVLEISARKADGTIIFQESQDSVSQRVRSRECLSDPNRSKLYHLGPSGGAETLVLPIFSSAPPPLEELHPGFKNLISAGRANRKPDAEIRNDIAKEIADIAEMGPELSADQVTEISLGCRTLSDAYQDARDEERQLSDAKTAAIMGLLPSLMRGDPIASELARQHAMDSVSKHNDRLKKIKTIKKRELSVLFKQPMKKSCRQPENLENFASQVFLLNAPTHTTFVIDLPLESIAAIQDVQARVTLKAAPSKAE